MIGTCSAHNPRCTEAGSQTLTFCHIIKVCVDIVLDNGGTGSHLCQKRHMIGIYPLSAFRSRAPWSRGNDRSQGICHLWTCSTVWSLPCFHLWILVLEDVGEGHGNLSFTPRSSTGLGAANWGRRTLKIVRPSQSAVNKLGIDSALRCPFATGTGNLARPVCMGLVTKDCLLRSHDSSNLSNYASEQCAG